MFLHGLGNPPSLPSALCEGIWTAAGHDVSGFGRGNVWGQKVPLVVLGKQFPTGQACDWQGGNSVLRHSVRMYALVAGLARKAGVGPAPLWHRVRMGFTRGCCWVVRWVCP